MDVLSSVKSGYQGFMSSLVKIGELNIAQMEKLSEKHMESAKYYTALGIENLKAAQGVTSVEGVKSFSTGCMERTGKAAKKLLEDGKSMVEMGGKYKDDVLAIIKPAAAKS